jgi:GntR family transcriptional repressor for pyruvate dehydrogenase complex
MADRMTKTTVTEIAVREPVQRQSDRIAGELRADILRGRYRPGERLPAERELATRLTVNRGSVREALKKLEQVGLVEIRRGDGAVVQHPQDASVEVIRDRLRAGDGLDRRVLEEVLDIHEMLLSGAVALTVQQLSDTALERARALVADLARPERTASEFHQHIGALVEIAAEAGGHLVQRLFRNTFEPAVLDGVSALCPYFPGDDPGFGDATRDLDAALVARDPEAVAAGVRELTRRARRRLGQALDAYEAARARRHETPPAA